MLLIDRYKTAGVQNGESQEDDIVSMIARIASLL
jgi:hypothetical protein